jgi:hydrogenase maturation protease
MGRAVVVCVGHSLVADDGVGMAVCERLERSALPAGSRLRPLPGGGIKLLDELEGEDLLIVVDAVKMGGPAGKIHALDWTTLPKGSASRGAQGVGLREALEVGRSVFPQRMPRQVVLVGVEGRVFEPVGTPMSPEVAAAVEPAAQRVLKMLHVICR